VFKAESAYGLLNLFDFEFAERHRPTWLERSLLAGCTSDLDQPAARAEFMMSGTNGRSVRFAANPVNGDSRERKIIAKLQEPIRMMRTHAFVYSHHD
jgi:hypothetical protein